MSETRMADCGVHARDSMDPIYTCVDCYNAKERAALELAQAVLGYDNLVPIKFTEWSPIVSLARKLLELAREKV